MTDSRGVDGFDALLFLSFGGPEDPSHVRPFLENVTRGRGVPPERLDAVVEHYMHFGGVSPINSLNRDIIAAVESELASASIPLPVYFGNRNWHPMVEDTVGRMTADGVRRALVFPTSAWGGYSGCRQYHEDIARARRSVGDSAPELVKIRQFYDHPLMIDSFADAITVALEQLPADKRAGARLVFTAHSIPSAADANAGPPEDGGHLYSRQVADASRLAAERAGFQDYDLVWQSRSGPPQVPWLEPDICDHLQTLSDKGVDAVLVCPVGFVSDHLEVVWDLDTEARDKAAELSMAFARVATPGTDPRFAKMVVELVGEYVGDTSPRGIGNVPRYGSTANGDRCALNCCEQPARRPVGAPR
ncbi:MULTISPECIES: ferrochelatase [Nocardiaceae]|uniref:ferrochelatase n=1 Tax=Nocardiaceae TaxID=85025 RepID=UPI000560C8B4|nr:MULTISPECIES: ferrochelatase [Rhodococcus]OZC53889.1 ferrochelatase [Rhodococcus sp. 06-621-2]OZD60219.1 ferrochelatase [Rhodococcus sp. 06-1059B-a]OZE98677.1 ferrochelatase [Rhodococcus sp. 15-1154-1]OZF45044.1 ferrochelatase [Rhodococcus sp. 14-2470-1a]